MYLCARKAEIDEKFGSSASLEPQVGKCSQCSHEIYYDKTSLNLASILGDALLVCNVCAEHIGVFP